MTAADCSLDGANRTRPFGVTLVLGAIHGGLAGGLVGLVVAGMIVPTGQSLDFALFLRLVLSCGCFGASLAAGEAVAAGARRAPARLALFASGFTAPFAAAAPVMSLSALEKGCLPWEIDVWSPVGFRPGYRPVLLALLVAVSLGAGQATVAPRSAETVWIDRLARTTVSAIVVAVFPLSWFVPFVRSEPPRHPFDQGLDGIVGNAFCHAALFCFLGALSLVALAVTSRILPSWASPLLDEGIAQPDVLGEPRHRADESA